MPSVTRIIASTASRETTLTPMTISSFGLGKAGALSLRRPKGTRKSASMHRRLPTGTHKVTVTAHWVDAEWALAPPGVGRAGSQHVFTTRLFRHTDHQPIANYRVRYRLLDGPPAAFLPSHAPEAVAVSDLNGNASVALPETAPAAGVNHIAIEIVPRPIPAPRPAPAL